MFCLLLTGDILLSSNVTHNEVKCRNYFANKSFAKTWQNSWAANSLRGRIKLQIRGVFIIQSNMHDAEFLTSFSCELLSQKRSIIDVCLGSKYVSSNCMIPYEVYLCWTKYTYTIKLFAIFVWWKCQKISFSWRYRESR